MLQAICSSHRLQTDGCRTLNLNEQLILDTLRTILPFRDMSFRFAFIPTFSVQNI